MKYTGRPEIARSPTLLQFHCTLVIPAENIHMLVHNRHPLLAKWLLFSKTDSFFLTSEDIAQVLQCYPLPCFRIHFFGLTTMPSLLSVASADSKKNLYFLFVHSHSSQHLPLSYQQWNTNNINFDNLLFSHQKKHTF